MYVEVHGWSRHYPRQDAYMYVCIFHQETSLLFFNLDPIKSLTLMLRLWAHKRVLFLLPSPHLSLSEKIESFCPRDSKLWGIPATSSRCMVESKTMRGEKYWDLITYGTYIFLADNCKMCKTSNRKTIWTSRVTTKEFHYMQRKKFHLSPFTYVLAPSGKK